MKKNLIIICAVAASLLASVRCLHYGSQVRELEALQTTTIETIDTVPAHHEPTDSLYYYSDQWADLRLNLKDTTFYYNIRDSLSTMVCREYRHRFLW